MKKILASAVGVVVVLGASWVCASWYTGKRIEQAAAVSLTETNAYLQSRFPALRLNLRAEHYHRGFFSSQARYVLESGLSDGRARAPGVAAADVEPVRVMLDAEIEHGPFPATEVDRGRLAPAMAYVTLSVAQNDVLEPLFQLTGGHSPFVSHARVTYRGDAGVDWMVPALSYKRDGRSLTFSGMKGDGDFAREARAFVGNLRVELIELHGGAGEDNVALSLEGLSAGLNTRRGAFDLGVGQSHVHVEHIEARMPDSSFKAELDNAGYRVLIEEDGKFVNLELVFGTESLRIGKTSLGTMRLVTRARQLDGEALQRMVREYDALSAGLAGNTDEDAAQARYSAATDTLMASGKQLLAGQPVFAIEPILWKTDKGEQRATLSVQLGALPETGPLRERVLRTVRQAEGGLSLSRTMAIEVATRLLVDHYDMQAEQARATVTGQLDEIVTHIQDMGLARLEDDKLVSRVRYADGAIDLNGEKMSLEDFAAKFDLPPGLDDDDLAEDEEGVEAPPDDEEQAVDAAGEMAEGETAMPDTLAPPDETLAALDTRMVASILDGLDRAYEIGTDGFGDPRITLDASSLGAQQSYVEYYDCGPVACENIQLVTRFAAGRAGTLKAVNAFNRDNRWARAYLNEDNQPVIELDIDGVGGITQGALTRQITAYFLSVDALNEALARR